MSTVCMPINQNPQQFCLNMPSGHETKPQELDLEGGQALYLPRFLSDEDADLLFIQLRDQTNWQQERITIYGKTHNVPRLSSWVAEDGLDYAYSNMTMTATPWTRQLLVIKAMIEARCNHRFNSVLLNYYRDGKDSNGWHSDDEPELGSNPVIASLSLGANRDFQLRYKKDKAKQKKLVLENGSLLVMSGALQHNWQHQLPKRAQASERINLTFRVIKNSTLDSIG